MNIEIISKNYKVSDKLRDLTEKKVGKLNKYFRDDAKVKVYFKNVKSAEIIEITIQYEGNQFIRAEASGKDMYEGLDLVLPKIEKQIIKYKTKIQNKLKSDAFNSKEVIYASAAASEAKEAEVAKVKKFDLLPMTVEEAIVNMDLLSHDFFMFLNTKNNEVEMVYVRADGTIGHIQPTKKV